jgi:hypothetical protein
MALILLFVTFAALMVAVLKIRHRDSFQSFSGADADGWPTEIRIRARELRRA